MGVLLELKLTWDAFWELIFPSKLYCIICRSSLSESSKYGICNSCLAAIDFIEEKRWVQALFKTDDGKGIRIFSVASYTGEIKNLIYDFKYNQKTYIGRHLAEMIKEFLMKEALDYDVIIPVPLFKRKEAKRGFNQSTIISKYLGQYTGVEVMAANLQRVRNTVIMHTLSRLERIDNVKEAFSLRNPKEIYNKRILLIDDILTTGATINECGRVLYEAGAIEVIACTLAKGVLEKD